ncbi:hypothetical protein [Brachymonas denitrificans]|uniref:hypothetical protein n=1 Tax=Brachymonas denitrificans TaxID=28220 RepID=UPI002AFE8093|nr:hypothetical protein [Brachymonas denitrificans]
MKTTTLAFRAALLTLPFILGGCLAHTPSASGNAGSGDHPMLQRRAAQTLGVPPSAVRISDVDNEGGMAGRVNFRATTGGKSYSCYLTSRFGTTSDALCTRAGGGIVGSQNNALLRAADRLQRR